MNVIKFKKIKVLFLVLIFYFFIQFLVLKGFILNPFNNWFGIWIFFSTIISFVLNIVGYRINKNKFKKLKVELEKNIEDEQLNETEKILLNKVSFWSRITNFTMNISIIGLLFILQNEFNFISYTIKLFVFLFIYVFILKEGKNPY